MFSDLRFAFRRLRRDPGVSLVTILTLGVGIGATTVIFSVFNATVLRDLPYAEAESLVKLSEVSPGGNVLSLSEPNFLEVRKRSSTFSLLAAVESRTSTLGDDTEPLRINGVAATEGLFRMLRVKPELGRAFLPGEFQRGDRPQCLIIAHGLWKSRFGSDPNILGRSVNLDGTTVTVVGVMPKGFDFPHLADFWTPLEPDPNAPRSKHVLEVFGRLAPGLSIEHAQADLNGVAARLSDAFPQYSNDWGLTIQSMRDWRIDPEATRIATVLLGAVVLLLLLACASVSNLMLARTTARRREMALRATLGALRHKLLGQLMVESLLLAFLSACAGLLFAAWVLPVIQALETESLPRLNEVTFDHTVVLFTALITVVTGIVTGAARGVQAPMEDAERALREGERIVTGGSRTLRDILVTCQFALAVVLLVVAGLLTNSLLRRLEVDPGFEAGKIFAVEVSLQQGSRKLLSPGVTAFYAEALDRIAAIPGVEAVGATAVSPLSSTRPSSLVGIEGETVDQNAMLPIQWRAVTPGFFEAMGSRLVSGRFFDGREASLEPRAFNAQKQEPPFNVVITEPLANRFWPSGGAMGKRLVFSEPGGPTATVVGVVSDVKDVLFPADPRPTVFVPHNVAPMPNMTVLVKVSGEPQGMAHAVRDAIGAVDESVSVPQMLTLKDVIESTALSGPRVNALIAGLFAAAALGLAALGIYGVTAFSVVNRKREIGVRMALGATPSRIVGITLSTGTKLIAIGTAIGLIGALGLSRFLDSLLYEITPNDPLTYAAVTLLLVVVATLAGYLPARRATKIDPRTAFVSD